MLVLNVAFKDFEKEQEIKGIEDLKELFKKEITLLKGEYPELVFEILQKEEEKVFGEKWEAKIAYSFDKPSSAVVSIIGKLQKVILDMSQIGQEKLNNVNFAYLKYQLSKKEITLPTEKVAIVDMFMIVTEIPEN